MYRQTVHNDDSRSYRVLYRPSFNVQVIEYAKDTIVSGIHGRFSRLSKNSDTFERFGKSRISAKGCDAEYVKIEATYNVTIISPKLYRVDITRNITTFNNDNFQETYVRWKIYISSVYICIYVLIPDSC